jgi:hypothetical protein
VGIFSSRYQESESSGFPSFIDWGKAHVQKTDFYKPPKSGTMQIDIVPYIIRTTNHPLVAKGKLKVGDLDYVLDIYVHRAIGATNTDVVCLKMNYGKPCPVCELANEKLRTNGSDDEEYKALKPKRRVLYNVLDAVRESDLQVFDVSHWFFEKELIDKAKYEGEKIGKAYLDFADPDEGYTIECRTTTEKFNTYDVVKFKDFSFAKRGPNIITDEDIEDAVGFDQFLNLMTTEEIERLLYGDGSDADPVNEDENEEEESAPTSRRRRRSSSSDQTEQPPKRTRSRRSVPVEESEETGSSEEEEEEEKEKEPKPTRRKSRSKPVPVEPEPDDPDPEEYTDAEEAADDFEAEAEEPDTGDDGEDEEEKPARPRRSTRKNSGSTTASRSKAKTESAPKLDKCPHGHKFGVDTDEFDDCDDCEVWQECIAARRASKKKGK